MFNRKLHKQILVLLSSMLVALTCNAEMVGNEELLDPTAPLKRVSASSALSFLPGNMPERFELSSILIRSNVRVAVLNSQRVSEGDKLGSAEVLKIDKESVTLVVGGENKVIKLYEHSVKTLSENEG